MIYYSFAGEVQQAEDEYDTYGDKVCISRQQIPNPLLNEVDLVKSAGLVELVVHQKVYH